jgi:two-component system, NarL family, response regulator NreC
VATSDDAPITIVLADDHAVMRKGLRMLLDAEQDLCVVSDVGNMQSVFRDVRSHRPDVLVLDLNMPGGSSIETISSLSRFSATAVVILTMEPDRAFMERAFEAGASGYVLKDAAPTELVRAIRVAVRDSR